MQDRKNSGVEIPIRIVNTNESQGTENITEQSAAAEVPENNDTAVIEEEPDVFEQLRSKVEENGDHLENPQEVVSWIQEASAASQDVKKWSAPILQRLVKAELQAWENHDLRLRATADLENFKKRALQEKSRILKYRNEELLRDLLPIVDNLRRALDHPVNSEGVEAFVEGVRMISGMFGDVLERYGVKEITAMDEKFDPHWHEALARIPVPDRESNTVVEELEKGYTYQDRLLRPSRVVVSGPADNAESQEGARDDSTPQ